jgi:hypothetical protein
MSYRWVWIPAAVAAAAVAIGVYSGLQHHELSSAFPYALLAAFAAGLAIGSHVLFGRRAA